MVYLVRIGNVVGLCCNVNHTYIQGTNSILSNIPVGYCPCNGQYGYPALARSDNAARAYWGKTGFSVYIYYGAVNNLSIYWTTLTIDPPPKVGTERIEVPQEGLLFPT